MYNVQANIQCNLINRVMRYLTTGIYDFELKRFLTETDYAFDTDDNVKQIFEQIIVDNLKSLFEIFLLLTASCSIIFLMEIIFHYLAYKLLS